jgi:hypothetical protein
MSQPTTREPNVLGVSIFAAIILGASVWGIHSMIRDAGERSIAHPPETAGDETKSAPYQEGLEAGFQVGLGERTAGNQKRLTWAREEGHRRGEPVFARGFAAGYLLGWDRADREIPRPIR